MPPADTRRSHSCPAARGSCVAKAPPIEALTALPAGSPRAGDAELAHVTDDVRGTILPLLRPPVIAKAPPPEAAGYGGALAAFQLAASLATDAAIGAGPAQMGGTGVGPLEVLRPSQDQALAGAASPAAEGGTGARPWGEL